MKGYKEAREYFENRPFGGYLTYRDVQKHHRTLPGGVVLKLKLWYYKWLSNKRKWYWLLKAFCAVTYLLVVCITIYFCIASVCNIIC